MRTSIYYSYTKINTKSKTTKEEEETSRSDNDNHNGDIYEGWDESSRFIYSIISSVNSPCGKGFYYFAVQRIDQLIFSESLYIYSLNYYTVLYIKLLHLIKYNILS